MGYFPMSDMKIELKSCPFCGSKNVVLENKNGCYQVRCRFCGARGKYAVAGLPGSRMEAINAWNSRVGENHEQG